VIQTVQVERPSIDLPTIPPLQLDGMTWYIVTESNFNDVMKDVKASGSQPVFFALDERGYENLSVNMTKIRAYITQQKTVIMALKNYYHVTDNPESLVPASPLAKTTNPENTKKEGATVTVVQSVPLPDSAKTTDSTKQPSVTPTKSGVKLPSFLRGK
jgi:hypothetical protein